MFTEPEFWVAVAFAILMAVFVYFGIHRTVLTALDHRSERIKAELDDARRLKEEAAKLLDQGEDEKARPMICGLKAEGVENALNAVDAAMRAFGGEGYSTLVDLGDRLRDLNGLRIADGTTDVMRMEVVRHTFGREFWDMAVKGRD